MVMAGRTRLAKEPAPETDQDWAQGEVRERQAEEADYAEQAIVPAVAALGGAHAGRDRQNDRYE
jgi:hypothetical protein